MRRMLFCSSSCRICLRLVVRVVGVGILRKQTREPVRVRLLQQVLDRRVVQVAAAVQYRPTSRVPPTQDRRVAQVAAVVRQVWVILRRLPLVVQHHRLHRMSVLEPRVVPVRGVERFRSLLM